MHVLIEKGGIHNINPKGRYFERAIARAQLSRWQDEELGNHIGAGKNKSSA
jgi:hypothetical protein